MMPSKKRLLCLALTRERYRADEWCALGSEVTAMIGGFNDRNYQVGLWQLMPGEQRRDETEMNASDGA